MVYNGAVCLRRTVKLGSCTNAYAAGESSPAGICVVSCRSGADSVSRRTGINRGGRSNMDMLINYDKETSGRCHRCNIRYIWKRNTPKLKDAVCPNCGCTKLKQTTHLFKGKSIRLLGGLPTMRRRSK
jgi:hypothetical protein